jgi:hypothetical protein
MSLLQELLNQQAFIPHSPLPFPLKLCSFCIPIQKSGSSFKLPTYYFSGIEFSVARGGGCHVSSITGGGGHGGGGGGWGVGLTITHLPQYPLEGTSFKMFEYLNFFYVAPTPLLLRNLTAHAFENKKSMWPRMEKVCCLFDMLGC